MRLFFPLCVITAFSLVVGVTVAADTAAQSLAVFEKRILPIMQAKRPSSCTECHLSGVELQGYIFSDQEKTFASLVAAGLIDVAKPAESKLLKFIERRPETPNLISDKVRQEESAAFRAWIEVAVKDPNLLKARSKATAVGPQIDDELIRHARKDRVLNSFAENVWSEIGRCTACHSPEKNQQQVKKFGDRVSWIKPRDMRGTMQHLLDSGIIDVDAPEKSLLLTKPTVQVEHGGGQKAMVGDRTYKQFRRFLEDYAAVVKGSYKRPAELPKPDPEVSTVSEIWLKVEGVPSTFDKLLLRADVYAQLDPGAKKVRVATGDRAVNGTNKLWQQHLTLTALRGSRLADELARAPKLAKGKYWIRISVDRTGKLAKNPSAELDDRDVLGEIEIQSGWPAGYGSMTVIKCPT